MVVIYFSSCIYGWVVVIGSQLNPRHPSSLFNFQNAFRPEVLDQEWCRGEGDPYSDWGKDFVNSVGHDKGGGSGSHRRLLQVITQVGESGH